MTSFQSILILVGRICFSMIFILGGFAKIFDFSLILQSMQPANHMMPELTLVAMIVLQLGGAFFIILGWLTRLGALFEIVALFFIEFFFHGYWLFQPQPSTTFTNEVWLTLAILGGALVLLACGPGRISVDGMRQQ